MMGGFSLHTMWVLVGDRSRYRFAAWLAEIPYESWDTKRCVWISREPVQEEHSEDVFLYSVQVPPGIRLCVPPDNEDAWKAPLAECSFCILLEEFPWQKESTEEILRRLGTYSPRPVTAVLLMKQQHRAGSTDLDKSGEAMAAARTFYQKKGIAVYDAERAHLTAIFSLRDSLIEKYREFLLDELLLMRDRMEELAEEDYALFLAACDAPRGCLGVETKEEVLSYRTVRKSGEICLWRAWNQAVLKRLFASGQRGNLHEALRLYKDVLTATDLPRWLDWDVVQECRQLEIMLERAFWTYMDVPAQYDIHIRREIVQGESDYARILLMSGVHIAYWKKYRQFVAEYVRDILLERLDKYCTHWKEWIS